ncbi:MAG: hypothetical protein ACRDRJ_39990 [Streptosporangiaceae bacterium]
MTAGQYQEAVDREVPVRVPTRWSPVALKNTSPGPELSGTVTAEPGVDGQQISAVRGGLDCGGQGRLLGAVTLVRRNQFAQEMGQRTCRPALGRSIA